MTTAAQLEAHIVATKDEMGKLGGALPHSDEAARFLLTSVALQQLQDRHAALATGLPDPLEKAAENVPKAHN